MSDDFVVVHREAVERELASKITPRRVTASDRRRDRENRLFCKSCHDWFIMNRDEDIRERLEASTVPGGPPSYIRFTVCPCGAAKTISISGESSAEHAKRAKELEERFAREAKTCNDCGTTPAEHYCRVCDAYFCAPNGCTQGEKGHHPTVHKPPLVEQLEKVDSRKALQDVIRPIRAEHDKHKDDDPVEHPDCPFCQGDIT